MSSSETSNKSSMKCLFSNNLPVDSNDLLNDLIRTSGLKECAMQWLHCVSAYFRGRPVFLVFSNIFRLIFEGRPVFEEIRYLNLSRKS